MYFLPIGMFMLQIRRVIIAIVLSINVYSSSHHAKGNERAMKKLIVFII